jgi:cation:H+ antiporter
VAADTEFGLVTNISVFVVSAGVVWFSGSRLATYADALAKRFALSEATVGVLLLAGVTSLPEIATSFSAASSGDAPLAVNNLLGSIALQITLLALADLVYDPRALTSIVPDPVLLLQGTLNICLLAFVVIATMMPDTLIAGAGIWSWLLLAAVIYSLRKITQGAKREPWVAASEKQSEKARAPERKDLHVSALGVKTVLSAVVILLAGYAVARSGENIAHQTGIGSSFMGVAFLALATSLPEFSTVFAAMRRGLYTMAISDILGTNIFNIALLLGIDVIAGGAPVLTRVGVFSTAAASIGILLTGLFLMGLAERRDRTVLRMGVDSAAVLVCYAGGLVFLFTLRGSA